jgi:hypothetical protein
MRPSRIEGVRISELLDGETVVSTPDAEKAVILNELGGVVYQLCDGQRTTAELAAFVADNVPGGADRDQVQRDVERVVGELCDAGVLELRE